MIRPTDAALRLVFTLPLTFACLPVFAQQPGDSSATLPSEGAVTNQDSDTTAATSAPSDREQKLADYLSGASFKGQFTIDGKEDANPKPKH